MSLQQSLSVGAYELFARFGFLTLASWMNTSGEAILKTSRAFKKSHVSELRLYILQKHNMLLPYHQGDGLISLTTEAAKKKAIKKVQAEITKAQRAERVVPLPNQELIMLDQLVAKHPAEAIKALQKTLLSIVQPKQLQLPAIIEDDEEDEITLGG